MTDAHLRASVERLLTTPAYHRWLGLHLLDVEPGRVVIALPYREEFLADVDGNYVHGGILATLADVAADFALISRLGYAVSTIDLRLDYLRPATPGQELRAEGTVVRCGRSLGVADASVTAESGRRLVAGRGVYSTAPPPDAASP